MSETKPTDDETRTEEEAPPPDDAETKKVETPSTNGTAQADAEAPEKKDESEPDPDPEPKKDEEEKDDEEPKDALLPAGNPPRWKRGLIALFAGGVPLFLLMAKNGQNIWSIPVGFLFLCVAAFGVMDLHGSFDDADEHVATRTTLERLAPPLAAFLGLSVMFGVCLWMAQAALLPPIGAAVLVPASFLGAVVFVFRLGVELGPFKHDETGEERPLLSRHGFWVIVVGALLYFPLLGVFSLWDPWETHYGEVAREILARDDWVSLWWAQDGWFWSKPILNFWIQSLAMGALGTHFQPDGMLIAANGTAAAHAEWVVRTPNVLMTIGAMYALYKGVAKVFGRRAGLLGAIVLATMPDWYFLAHQTMTDMPFVAAMTAAMGLLLYGLNTDEETRARCYEVDVFGAKLRFSLWHLVFGAVLLCAIPQIVYLLSRNIELVVFGDGPKGFRVHWDEFKSGSAGNCGLPGNEACASHVPASLPKQATWWYSPSNPGAKGYLRFFGAFEPALQAIVWGSVLGGVLYVNWGERRVRRLVYIMAWLCAAIATMAKGPAGFGLPIICAFAYVATKKRWGEILRFEMVSGFLVIFCVALPWYVAMYVRHGSPFTDRLIFHDMFNRAFSHVHDTNEGDDTGIRYYVWQLGYAAFPWTGLVPFGLLWGFRRSDSAIGRFVQSITGGKPEGARETKGSGLAVGDASVLLVMWFIFAFALFTFMGTKFHHYIFPAVPPAAMLVGVLLDDMLGRVPFVRPRSFAVYLAGITAGAAALVFGASRLWSGSIFGRRPMDGAVPQPFEEVTTTQTALGVVAIAVGIGIIAFVVRSVGALLSEPAWEVGDEAEAQRRQHEQLMIGAAVFAAALVTLVVGRDLSRRIDMPDGSGAIRLLQLFTYNYKRPWPETLDFSAALNAFTFVGAALAALAAVKRYRAHLVTTFAAFAMLWAVWGLDVYMMALSPHWGQHELIEAYYRNRASPEERLIAYQMNWKGENFYTGNRIPAFVSTGTTFANFMKKEREKGTKVLFLVTEHSRVGGLKSEVGARAYKELTDKALCNKFVLVRAEL
ncbi:MAG: glycosyltransferase family 39 protein [Labilithrix sp.]|nr:glycosyltransferase family 39 protein [Labilithrix sp.]MCW5812716.1 glycosyltransferase family 39 protein [Labilithrix sp.]